jgi:hypothetical protein
MPFNPTDFTKAPWAAGIMTLTHEECVYVLDTIENEVRPNYKPEYYEPQEPSDFWLQSEYNKLDWKKGINGDSYAVLKGYNPEVNTLGIDGSGIVQPVEEEVNPGTSEPVSEVVAEEEAPTETVGE